MQTTIQTVSFAVFETDGGTVLVETETTRTLPAISSALNAGVHVEIGEHRGIIDLEEERPVAEFTAFSMIEEATDEQVSFLVSDDETPAVAAELGLYMHEFVAHVDLDPVDVAERECPGHPCEDAADLHPHAGIGEVFYCDGSCLPDDDDDEWEGEGEQEAYAEDRYFASLPDGEPGNALEHGAGGGDPDEGWL